MHQMLEVMRQRQGFLVVFVPGYVFPSYLIGKVEETPSFFRTFLLVDLAIIKTKSGPSESLHRKKTISICVYLGDGIVSDLR